MTRTGRTVLKMDHHLMMMMTTPLPRRMMMMMAPLAIEHQCCLGAAMHRGFVVRFVRGCWCRSFLGVFTNTVMMLA